MSTQAESDIEQREVDDYYDYLRGMILRLPKGSEWLPGIKQICLAVAPHVERPLGLVASETLPPAQGTVAHPQRRSTDRPALKLAEPATAS